MMMDYVFIEFFANGEIVDETNLLADIYLEDTIDRVVFI